MHTKLLFLPILIAALLPAPISKAQSPRFPKPIHPTLQSGFLDGLVAEMTVTGDVTVTPETAEQLKDYQKYLKDIEAWERKAIELTKSIKIERKGAFIPYYPTHFNPAMVGQHSFPQKVVEQMPPKPPQVTVPTATKLPMTIKVTNPTDSPVHFDTGVYSDFASISFSIKGPNAYQFRYGMRGRSMEIRPGNPSEIPPGGSIEFNLKATGFGDRGQSGYWILAQPGEYEITATIRVNQNFRFRDQITTKPCRFAVVTQNPNAAPAE